MLPQGATGKLLFALGLSEPNVGADLASVETRAEVSGDDIIINGAKRWCTGADYADYIYALVRSGPPDQRRHNLSFILIPTKIGRTHVRTPVTNAQLVCRLLLEKKNTKPLRGRPLTAAASATRTTSSTEPIYA